MQPRRRGMAELQDRFRHRNRETKRFRLSPLFLTLTNFYVKADHAVLISRANDGYVLADVVLALNDLLGRLRHVLAVGQREVVGDLLLDGHLRTAGGIGLGAQALGVDLDLADTQ